LAKAAQAILDLRRKPIQFLVLLHIETWEQVDEIAEANKLPCMGGASIEDQASQKTKP
jgi:hypothetical protein